jgi:hypothetical protein
MKQGENNASICLKLELKNVIDQYAGKAKQNKGFWIISRLLTVDSELKQEIIKAYDEETYNALLTHYSKTNIQQRAENELKLQVKTMREDFKMKLEEIKAENYAKQTSVAVSKFDDKMESKEAQILDAKQRLYKNKIEHGDDGKIYQTQLTDDLLKLGITKETLDLEFEAYKNQLGTKT